MVAYVVPKKAKGGEDSVRHVDVKIQKLEDALAQRHEVEPNSISCSTRCAVPPTSKLISRRPIARTSTDDRLRARNGQVGMRKRGERCRDVIFENPSALRILERRMQALHPSDTLYRQRPMPKWRRYVR